MNGEVEGLKDTQNYSCRMNYQNIIFYLIIKYIPSIGQSDRYRTDITIFCYHRIQYIICSFEKPTFPHSMNRGCIYEIDV